MARRCHIKTVAVIVVIALLMPAVALANNLNIVTGARIPMRPHVNLNATIHLDVRARTFPGLDLSEACRAEDRIRKRDRRCRRDR